MERIGSNERLKLTHRAEREIMRYQDDHALWHKHVHGVELDPVQILKCLEMDAHANTIDVSCRRTGKTAIKELYALKNNACKPAQEVGIVAPRSQQSQNNLNYHLEAIRRSPILSNYLAYKSGRRQATDMKYQLYNGSRAQAYGIMSQIDGDALSFASIEEIDDMPADRLLSRFLPMLGGARRMGVGKEVSFKPQIRITGVYKGADVLQSLIDTKQYALLPTVDCYLGIEMGILNEQFILDLRTQLPEGEFIRQLLCRNVSSQNHIWEKYILKAKAVGLQARLEIAEPMPGQRYKKRGTLSFGYDHTGHGETPEASKSALVVLEQIGNYVCFVFVKTWPAGTDDKVIEMDLLGIWEYFAPDCAIGDAYGIGMLSSLNDRLYARGLTYIDRRTIGDGQSTATTWTDWAFQPIRFEGMTKHSMASVLRAVFHNGQAAIPYFEDRSVKGRARDNEILPDAAVGTSVEADYTTLVRQLGNIKQLPTKTSYSSYKMADRKVGDDLYDAAMAAVWALTTRGSEFAPSVIMSRGLNRSQLLGAPAELA